MFAIIRQFVSLNKPPPPPGGAPPPPPWAGADGGKWATWDNAKKAEFCAAHTDQAGKGDHDTYCPVVSV